MPKPMAVRRCTIDSCSKRVISRDMCPMHYRRWRLSGKDPALAPESRYAPRPLDGLCTIEGCGKRHVARGMCQMHYRRVSQHGSPDAPLPRYATALCSVEGCGKPRKAGPLCAMHGARMKKYGTIDLPKWLRKHPHLTNPNGYRYVGSGKARKLVHRAIMEKVLGRELRPEETVHHKNGQRADNREDNLELWSSSQPAGQRVADKLAWAREILALYAGEIH